MNSMMIALNIVRRLFKSFYLVASLLILLPLVGSLIAVTFISHYELDKVGINQDLPSNHRLVQAIKESKRFELIYINERDLQEKIKNKEVDMGLFLPDQFEKKLARQDTSTQLNVVSLTSSSGAFHLRLLVEDYAQAVFLGTSSSGNQFLMNAKHNIPAQKASLGFLLLFMILLSASGVQLLLEDKTNKTLMRTYCAPVRVQDIILGNLLANIGIGLFQIILFLLFTTYLFGFEWKVPLIQLFMILSFFLLSSLGLSLGLAGFIRDKKLYAIMNAMVGMFTCLIGGAFFPSNIIGSPLNNVSNFLPQQWAIQSYEKLVNGSTLSDIQMNLSILFLFGAVFSTFGVKLLRPDDHEI